MFGFGANLTGDVTSEGVYHLASSGDSHKSEDGHKSKRARTFRAVEENLYDNPMETSDTPSPRTSVREGARNKAARIAPGRPR